MFKTNSVILERDELRAVHWDAAVGKRIPAHTLLITNYFILSLPYVGIWRLLVHCLFLGLFPLKYLSPQGNV